MWITRHKPCASTTGNVTKPPIRTKNHHLFRNQFDSLTSAAYTVAQIITYKRNKNDYTQTLNFLIGVPLTANYENPPG